MPTQTINFMKNLFKIPLFNLIGLAIIFFLFDFLADVPIVYNATVIDKFYQPVTKTPSPGAPANQRHTSITVYETKGEKYWLNIKCTDGEIDTVECPEMLYSTKEPGDKVQYVKKAGYITGMEWGKEIVE